MYQILNNINMSSQFFKHYPYYVATLFICLFILCVFVLFDFYSLIDIALKPFSTIIDALTYVIVIELMLFAGKKVNL